MEWLSSTASHFWLGVCAGVAFGMPIAALATHWYHLGKQEDIDIERAERYRKQ